MFMSWYYEKYSLSVIKIQVVFALKDVLVRPNPALRANQIKKICIVYLRIRDDCIERKIKCSF